MSSSVSHVIEGWKQLNYSELLRDLDRSVTEVAKRQDESDASRKRLVELSREYKRNTHEDIRRPVAPLLKKFQTEIDDLSRRAKSVETALLDVFKKLIDVPDPVPALEHAMTVQKKIQRLQDIEIENKQLRDTLEEYNAEFAEVKNQEVTIKQLREKIRELEGDAEEAVTVRVRERERELATRYGDLERELSERQMEVAAKLGETELKNKTLQSALEKTQTELIELKLKFEEVTTAKTDEIEILVSDIDKANERASSVERENQSLRTQLEQVRSEKMSSNERSSLLDAETTEETLRRTEVEMELTSKEKEISQLVDEVRRLQASLKQTQETNNARVQRLEEELRQKNETLTNLESFVSARDDYDEVKRELDVLRAIEFNTSDSAVGDSEKGAGNSKPKPLEQLLVEKNKSLQNEVTQLKVTNQQQTTSSSSTISTLAHSSVLESVCSMTPTVSVPLCSPHPSKPTNASTPISLNLSTSLSATDATLGIENGLSLSGLSSASLVGRQSPSSVIDSVTPNSTTNTLLVTNDSIPPLDTFKVAQKVREVLSAHNIGQRLFARHVLGLSQGTVSELLSKPKTWDKLTEKGRDSYRRMFAWVGNNDQVLALKALAPRKGYSVHFHSYSSTTNTSSGNSSTTQVVVSANASNREDQATEEKINAILNEAKRAMDSNGSVTEKAGGKNGPRASHQPPILPRKIAQDSNNGSVLPFSVNMSAIEAALQLINCIKPSGGPTTSLKSEPVDIFDKDGTPSIGAGGDSSGKNGNSGASDKAIAASTPDTSSIVRRIYYGELCKIAESTRAGDKASFDKYQDEINRLEREYPELKEPIDECTDPETGLEISTKASSFSSVTGKPLPTVTTTISPLAQMSQITKSLGGMTTPFARTLFFGDIPPVATGACDLSRNSNSPSNATKPNLQPLSQEFLENFEPICTETIVTKIKELLSSHSISQRVFGEQVLGLSQGSVSDLLARPKTWNMLTHKGREPFIRMKLFLDEPTALERLIQNSTSVTPSVINCVPLTPVTSSSSMGSSAGGTNTNSSTKDNGVIAPTIRPADPLVMSKLADAAKAKQTAALKLVATPSPPPVFSDSPASPQQEESVQPRDHLILKRCSVPACDKPQVSAVTSIYHLAKTSSEVDTLAVSNSIKEVLQVNNLGQRLFGEVVLGLSQGSVSELLSKPKPWPQLSIKGREPYIRMQKWLDEVKNCGAVEKLKEKQKELKGSRCSKRNQDCLFDGSSSQPSSASKKPRVVFSESQKQVLLTVYNREPYPSSATLDELSRQLNLPLKTINNWFHNHRMRTKMFVGPSTSPSPSSDSPSAPPMPVLTPSPGPLSTTAAASVENDFVPFDLRVKVVKQEPESPLDLVTCSGSRQSVQTSNYQTSQPVNKRKRTNPTRITAWKEEQVESCEFDTTWEACLSNKIPLDTDDQLVS